MNLQEALAILNLPELSTVDYAASSIIHTARQKQKCLTCTKTGAEAANCVETVASIEDGDYVFRCGICAKGRAYLRQKQIDKLQGASGIGERFKRRRFDTFQPTLGTEIALIACKNFCENFTPHARGIRLTGTYGCGKTHLAAAILNELIPRGIPGMFVVVPELLRQIRRGIDDKTMAEKAGKIVELASEIDLLILDDLGAENTSDWVREQLFILLNNRYEKNLPTIVTTNHTTKELIGKLQQRIVSRLVEMTESITMTAGDWRLMHVM